MFGASVQSGDPRREGWRTIPSAARAAVFFLIVLPYAVDAQATRAVRSEQLDSTVIHHVVDSIATLVEAEYVLPDTGKLIAAYLRERLQSGAYVHNVTRPQLADVLSTDMERVNGDLHLYVRPAPVGEHAAGPRMIMLTPGADRPTADGAGSSAQRVMLQPGGSTAARMAVSGAVSASGSIVHGVRERQFQH